MKALHLSVQMPVEHLLPRRMTVAIQAIPHVVTVQLPQTQILGLMMVRLPLVVMVLKMQTYWARKRRESTRWPLAPMPWRAGTPRPR